MSVYEETRKPEYTERAMNNETMPQSWTFSWSHTVFLMNTTKFQTSLVSSHDLHWEKENWQAKKVYSLRQNTASVNSLPLGRLVNLEG